MKIELQMQCAIDLHTAPDCACPYEHWHLDGVCLDIHCEETGDTHLFLCGEDWEFDSTLPGIKTLDQARPLAIAWAQQQLRGASQ